MKTYRVSLTFMTTCVLLIVSPFLTARGTAGAPVAANDLSIAARGVLVRAHNARTSAGASAISRLSHSVNWRWHAARPPSITTSQMHWLTAMSMAICTPQERGTTTSTLC